MDNSKGGPGLSIGLFPSVSMQGMRQTCLSALSKHYMTLWKGLLEQAQGHSTGAVLCRARCNSLSG